jgi:ribonuclease HI
MHVLRDCEEVKMFWNDLICQDDWSKFFSLGLNRWLDWNITTLHIGSKHDNWQIFFRVAVYELWKDRNSLVFNRKSLIENQLLYLATNQANFITSSSNLHVESNLYPSKRSIEVSWTPPPHDHYKVNVDGSHKKSSGISTCGGLIRDSNGKCIRGFYNRLGSCSAVWAELWALRIGIEMANQLNIKNVIFEMDSLVVVNMVNLGSSPNAFLQPLLQEVITLLHHPGWSTSVCHVYREANRCADLLANLGHTSLDFNCNFIDVFSPTLKLLLEDDVRGVSFPRLIQ